MTITVLDRRDGAAEEEISQAISLGQLHDVADEVDMTLPPKVV